MAPSSPLLYPHLDSNPSAYEQLKKGWLPPPAGQRALNMHAMQKRRGPITLTPSVARVRNPEPDEPSIDDEGFHLHEEDDEEFWERGQRRHHPQL